MKRYERITYRTEGARRSKTELFIVDAETPTFLLLTPVDSEGRDRSHYNADGALVEVQHLIFDRTDPPPDPDEDEQPLRRTGTGAVNAILNRLNPQERRSLRFTLGMAAATFIALSTGYVCHPARELGKHGPSAINPTEQIGSPNP